MIADTQVQPKAVRPQGRRVSRNSHKRSMVVIGAVLLLLTVALGVNMLSIRTRDQMLAVQEQELLAEIEEQQLRAEEIASYAVVAHTDEYIRQVAQERLGLVSPNEIIFVPVAE